MSDEYTRPFPEVVRIEPAAACNLSCSHCPTGTVSMARNVMRPETFSRVIECLKPHRGKIRVVVLYHGGEPFLNKRFAAMVRQVKSLGVPFVKTVSNGMILTDSVIADLVDCGLDTIEFSLDGRSPEENDLVRRNCRYDKVVNNVKRLIRCKRKQGAERPRIYLANTQFLTAQDHRPETTDPDPPPYLIAEFSEYAQDIAGFKCTWAMRWPHMEVMEELYDVYFDPYDPTTSSECDHVLSTVTIRANGDVVPCCYDLTSRQLLGNLLEDDLDTIWNNERYRRLRRSIAHKSYLSPCTDCNVVQANAYLTLKPELRERLDGSTGGSGG